MSNSEPLRIPGAPLSALQKTLHDDVSRAYVDTVSAVAELGCRHGVSMDTFHEAMTAIADLAYAVGCLQRWTLTAARDAMPINAVPDGPLLPPIGSTTEHVPAKSERWSSRDDS